MGSTKATLRAVALAAAAGAVALAPSAYAQDGGAVSVSPSSPAPGGDVALRVSGCASRTGTAHSAAFVAQAALARTDDGTLAGDTRVRSSIGPGTYDVAVACADTQVKGTITVVARSSAGPTGPASPVAPVPAGGGGTAHLAATDARPAGPGTVHTVTGLLLACTAASAVAVLGARRGRRTG